MKWVQEPFLMACHYDAHNITPYHQCSWKTSMVHQTFVQWALYILLKFVKSLIRHLGLAIGNVRHVRWFSWTLYHACKLLCWFLAWLESSGLPLYIYTLFVIFALHFDVEFPSESILSRPPTIGKIDIFLIVVSWSWRHNADTWELSASHILQSIAGDAIDQLIASCHVDTMAGMS